MRRTSLLGLLLALALLGACGQAKAPSAADLQDKISDQVRAIQPSLTAAQGDCYAKLLVKEVGRKDINDLKLTEKAPDAATAKAIATAAVAAARTCGIAAPPTAGGAATTSSTTSTTTAAGAGGTGATSSTAAG